MTAPAVTWSHGGTATLVSARGETLVFDSSVPAPPGSRLEGRLDRGLEPETPETVVKVKVHSSKKTPDGRFRLEGRAFDLTRVVRELLERAAGG